MEAIVYILNTKLIMKKQRILLISNFYYPELTGIGKFNGEMIEWFSKQGHECAVVAPYPYYPAWKIQDPYVDKSYWFKHEQIRRLNNGLIDLYRCPHYIPNFPTGRKRLLSDLSFFVSAFLKILFLLLSKKYDYVIVVAPSFHLGFLGMLYQKIKGVKFVYHIQDLQIEAAYELGMLKHKFLIRLMLNLEKVILKRADFISSISEGMMKKIQKKCNRSIVLFPNWVDLNSFFPIVEKKKIKSKLNIGDSFKIVLYSGSIGEKQGIENLFYSIKEMGFRTDVKFIICSVGPYLDKLIDLTEKMNLKNVIFKPLQLKREFNELLNIADLHLVLQKNNANDLVMPSKLANILAVGGLVLVTAKPVTSLYDIIVDNKIGLVIGQENHSLLTLAILEALDKPNVELKKNAREYVVKNLDINIVIFNFFSQIISL